MVDMWLIDSFRSRLSDIGKVKEWYGWLFGIGWDYLDADRLTLRFEKLVTGLEFHDQRSQKCCIRLYDVQ